jgi:signal transduction histidine kinase
MQRNAFALPIGNPDSLNWRTHLIFAIPALLSAGFFDYDRLGGNPILWLSLSIIGLFVTIGSIELLSLLVKKRQWKKPHAFVALSILILAGFFRGLSLLVFGQLFGIVPETDVIYRLTGGPIFVVAIYFLADLVVSSLLQHRGQLQSLEARKAELVSSRSGFEAELLRLDEMQRARVRELVAPSIWELQKHLSATTKNVQDAIYELRSLNEQIVRPLSHQYAASSNDQALSLPGAIGRPSLARPRGLPKRVNLTQAINPAFYLYSAIMLGFSSQSAVLGLVNGVLLVALVTPILMLGVLGFRFLLRGKVVRFSRALVLIALSGSLIGLVAGLLVQLLGLTASELFPVQAMMFSGINMLFTFLIGAIQQERDGSLAELEKTIAELEVLNSSLKQRAWLARKSLAMELHGSIQATLQSVTAKLAKLKNPSDRELEKALEQVRSAFDRIGNQDYLAGKSLEELLDELVLLWEGALDLSISVSADAALLLNEDQALARCVLEACREAVTNAVKHGGAEQVRISVTKDESFINVVAKNDGNQLTGESTGRGFELFRDIAHRFSLTNEDQGVTLEVQLPLLTKP